jgi:hypothetical protein
MDLKVLVVVLVAQVFVLALLVSACFTLVEVAVQATKKDWVLLVAVMDITILAHRLQQLLALQIQVAAVVVVEILATTLAAMAHLAS